MRLPGDESGSNSSSSISRGGVSESGSKSRPSRIFDISVNINTRRVGPGDAAPSTGTSSGAMAAAASVASDAGVYTSAVPNANAAAPTATMANSTKAKKPSSAIKRFSKVQLLCSSDGTVFDVTEEEAMMSSMMWMLVQDDGGSRSKRASIRQHTIPVHGVPSSSIELALYYCRCLYKQEIEDIDDAMDDFADLFDQLDSKILCDLAKVASNLDIQPLVDITCRSIAQIMSATDAAHGIRQKFGLEDGSELPGFDLSMFTGLDHDLSTEEYDLVEFDQPSVDELVNFINGDNGRPTKSSRSSRGKPSSIDGGFADSTTSANSKKKKKKKKSKKKATTVNSSSNSYSNDDPDRDADVDDAESDAKAMLTAEELHEKMLLAQENLSAVFPESEFEDDEDEELEEQIESFRLALESAHLESKQAKLKPRVEFTPRDVFRNRARQLATYTS